MKYIILNIVFPFLVMVSFSQEKYPISIHQNQSEFYKSYGKLIRFQYDSINKFQAKNNVKTTGNSVLTKRVFGYHPYWAGSNYLNYHWDLISDLCYFSYEVDPLTGAPETIHDWEDSKAIDSALANNVKVHLCVTLFSGHYGFFSNEDAQQTLIDNIIELIVERGAHGVNLDVEALPSSLGEYYTEFIINLSAQLNDTLPETEISIAAPAVNWSGTIEIDIIKEYIDFFMVMSYDYYWNGSNQAGPVGGLYSMLGSYNYNVSNTISYYQSEGLSNEMIVVGVPYYARQWPTLEELAPSNTTGNGTALTYANIKNNLSGNYNNGNKHLEENSFAPFYSFYDNGWYQCFVEDSYSLGEKYDIINRRNLGGIGIWALGYDNAYDELWELIGEKFTENASMVNADTIYDSGGPAFDYYDHEFYDYLITTNPNTQVHLVFSYINLEYGYDTLWVVDGISDQSPIIAFFTGDTLPSKIVSSGNNLLLRFYSDGASNEMGWRAVYDTIPISGFPENNQLIYHSGLKLYPNPCKNQLNLEFNIAKTTQLEIVLSDITFKNQFVISRKIYEKGPQKIQLNSPLLKSLPMGIYIVSVKSENDIISEVLIKSFN